ncbi:hypothetical protein [Aestuariicoccus sp. MJ-SS9]|uniref:hypothetical protein n=1 Tax=Aestuariicoccus sp. MJ-SS9 TaxID=3079855 RepID=UPI0029156D80|nr:hypothetical protein [Aestuariicoccus sp. MJ-SS9]MDU8913818.1 hypothetical protein [Aestuariicoccus sp. MJ-SS9]
MERRREKIMRGIGACALVMTVTGCVETAPEIAISEPDPELNFVRGYRNAADECQLVGETPFTVDFLDDATDLVACPTDSAGMASLMAETGAQIITQTNSFSFFSIPYR